MTRKEATQMRHFSFMAACLLFILGSVPSASPQSAGPTAEATITYDARLREFRCWREGHLTDAARNAAVTAAAGAAASVCTAAEGWHPALGGLYFTRGQALSLLLVNAVAADLFEINAKADDLAEPAVPILGSLASVPKMVPLRAPATIVAGNNTSFAALKAAPPVSPLDIFRRLTTLAEKDFASTTKSALFDPLSAKGVSDLLGTDVASQAMVVSNFGPRFIASAQAIKARVSAVTAPADTAAIILQARSLANLLEEESALRNGLDAVGMMTAGKTLSGAIAALNTGPLQSALSINSADLAVVTSAFETAFPQDYRYARIAALTIQDDAQKTKRFAVAKTYGDAAGNPATDMQPFLDRLNAVAPQPLTDDTLKKTQTNLNALADVWSDVRVAQARLTGLTTVRANITGALGSLLDLQTALNDISAATIQKAAAINIAARTAPLDESLVVVPIGRWFGSKTVTITLKEGQRLALFDVTGVSNSTQASVTGDDTPAAKPTQTPASALADVRTLQFEVHNLYHVQLGLGFLRSSVHDDRFQVDTVTSGTGSSATTQKFIDQTTARSNTLLTTVNLIVFPKARQAFPWRARYGGEAAPSWYEDFGAMLGFSVTSPSKDFIVGGIWFPHVSPVGLQFGWHIALRDYPTPGFDRNAPIPDGTRIAPLQQERVNGYAAGLVFTTDFFANVFGAIFKP